jgi:hypothetical protein
MTNPPADGEITPDTKDWTWTLRERCPDCGFEAASVQAADIATRVTAFADPWPHVLARPHATTRPAPTTWSPLEYACHVRDVYRLFAVRLKLMLSSDDPLFANWDQDETAVAERYGEQDPATVAAEIVAAGEAIAADFEAVQGDQWQRTGRRSDGAAFTVDSFARYFVHDSVHHVHDVTT